MLHWAQEIKGYVTIRVWGYSVERFLNLCGNHDILVWDIENHDGYTTMNISVKGFYEMKPLLKKTGTRASIVQKYGLPFFLSRWQKRKIFLAGLIGCMLFWILTSGFIWNIRIQGNYTLTEDVLLDYLKSQGVYVSMRQKNVHIEELEKALREHYDVITWTSVERNVAMAAGAGRTPEERLELAKKLVKLVRLEDYADMTPVELSTGMRQRLGLARVLASQAQVLLMDEPFASLDFITRGELQAELLDIQKELQKTILLVTHQLDEALLLAQKIVVLHADSSVRVWELELPYPRDLTSPQLTALREEITAECRKD